MAEEGHKESHLGRREAIAWALVVLWAVAIFAVSAKSGLELDGTGPIAQVKRWLANVLSDAMGYPVDVSPIGHFSEYLVFGALLANALRHRLEPGGAAIASVCVVAVYAVTDEFHQLFVPGRACDPMDWLVDVCAAAIAALIAWLVLRRRKRAGR